MTVLLAAALIPPLFLIFQVYRIDRVEKEPLGLLIKLFIFGAIAVVPAVLLEMLGTDILLDGLFSGSGTLVRRIVENFIVVALVEEGCKRFFLKRGSWRHPAFDYCFDAIVYSVVVSLGFAALENIGYVFQYGLQVAAMRAVTSIPGHCIFGIFMGHYYGMARMADAWGDKKRSRSMLRKSLWVPVFLHGFYDFTASMDNSIVTIVFFVYLVVLDIVAIRSIRRYSRQDFPI
ncbi:MAG: PrsW family intramembrane metalloprotease [Anaerovoracaceae bacterium]|jgi:RsiW-degrading membrane proteinase PrsW (M82 family)